MKQKLILIISVVIGLLAAVLTRSYLTAKDREILRWKAEFDRKHTKIEVVGVKKDLPSGTVLTKDDIGSIKVFENAYRGHVVKIEDHLALINRKTVRPLQANAVIFWSDIEGGEPGSRGLAGDIKQRMRALSINVSGAASVSGMVKPNDHVDVIGTFSFPSKSVPGELELVTLTMLQDVLVLATGKETAKTQLLADPRAGAAYSMVTLEVSPREAEMLVFAEQIKGRISLALRNPDDVYFEKTLPRVDFQMIQSEIESLNTFRQQQLLRKRAE
ncbi:MAG TPA: Flp pilus assembly protein CpaB [Kiritimatiellia bacterium]|nr:Flp pilus assembly protein CpaB [Kiritimatiellia bacterium]HPS09287.1 Flp pilus assembly protein CpaB [Kiritimatiellia bacterium]